MTTRPTAGLTARPLYRSTTIASTTSNITLCDLYIKSLEESLAAARKYVARERVPAAVTNPMALLRAELEPNASSSISS